MDKTRIENYLEYLLSIAIILNCNSILIRSQNIDGNKIIDYMLFSAIVLLIFICIKNISNNKKMFLWMLILITFISLYNLSFIFINDSNQFDFIKKFVIIFNLFIIYSIYKQKCNKSNELLLKISNIIIVLAIISLIFYLFGSCLKLIDPSNTTLIEWGGIRDISNYYNLYYEAQDITMYGKEFYRNTGIFSEAPMYSFLLCIALMVQLFLKKKLNKINITILMATIFSTLSTTGVLVSSVLIILKFIVGKSKKRVNLIVKLLVLPIIIFSAVIVGTYFTKDKVNGSSGSYTVRMDDLGNGIRAWKEHKIIGIGYGRQDLTAGYTTLYNKTNNGASSGLMTVLPEGGIYLLSIYLMAVILSIKYGIKNRNINLIIISITTTSLFTITAIQYTYIMIYLLSLGWTFILKKLNTNV